MSASKIFLFSCLSLIVGVAFSAFVPPEKFSADFLFYNFVLLLVFLVALVFNWSNKKVGLIIILALFFVFGFWRYQISWPKNDFGRIEAYVDQKITFQGIIDEEPDERIDNQRLAIKVYQAEGKKISGRILVTASIYPQYDYGDHLRINCKIQKPENFNGFAYDRYLAISDIYAVCGFAQIEVLEKNQGKIFYQKIFTFKKRLRQIITENLTEPAAGFLSAFVLGDKKSLDQNLFDNFAKAGLAHIIAISGQHITIIFALLLSFFISLGFWRSQAFYLIISFLIFYVAIIGAPASAVRAAIMGGLLLWAMQLGRLNKADRAISLAAALMLLVNPKFILDAGWQLSFAAVLGIIYFYPYLRNRFFKIPSFWGLRDIVFMTLAAQVAVLPLGLYYFKRLPLIFSFLANLLVLPVLPLVLALGFIVLFLALVYLPAAKIIFWFLWLILSYIIGVAQFLPQLPFSYWETNIFPWWGVAMGYLIILLIFTYLNKLQSKNVKLKTKNHNLKLKT